MSETKKPDPYAVQGARSDAAKGPKPSAPTLRFSARIQDGVHVIKFEQSNVLDAHEIEQLGDDIYHHLKPVDTPRVVIDLENVEHFSSAALGMLIALRKIVVDKKSGGLGIANLRADLRPIFTMTKLDKLLTIHDSTEQAIYSMA